MAVESPPSVHKPMKNSLAKRFLSLVLLVASAGLVLGAAYALRRNCESFGCPNSSVLWTAWALIYAAVGALGWRLRSGLRPATPSRTMTTGALVVLAVLGVALAAKWMLTPDAA